MTKDFLLKFLKISQKVINKKIKGSTRWVLPFLFMQAGCLRSRGGLVHSAHLGAGFVLILAA